jgi:four helix bundle protein
MNSDSPLLQRTRAFAVAIATLVDSIPNTIKGRIVANQLMKSATSVAANYRATRRARSKAEFVAKLGVVLEEIDESVFWLDYAIETGILHGELVFRIRQEADEIAAMSFASRRTALKRKARSPDNQAESSSEPSLNQKHVQGKRESSEDR